MARRSDDAGPRAAHWQENLHKTQRGSHHQTHERAIWRAQVIISRTKCYRRPARPAAGAWSPPTTGKGRKACAGGCYRQRRGSLQRAVRNGSWRQRPIVIQRSDKEPFGRPAPPASNTIIARWRWTNKKSSRFMARQLPRRDAALVSNGQTIRARHCRSSCRNFATIAAWRQNRQELLQGQPTNPQPSVIRISTASSAGTISKI